MFRSCPACGAPEGAVFFEMPGMPVLANALYESAGEARRASRGDIRLALCLQCGLAYNAAFDPGLVEYGAHYENALHYSAHFRAYAQGLAERLVERFALRGKRILEIGCGDGQFLALLCAKAGSRGVGFDPSHDPARAHIPAGVDVQVHAEPFTAHAAAADYDMVVCRHVLEHLSQPKEFLDALRARLNPRGGAYFEVPDSLQTFSRSGIWDIVYEHCLYFTAPSLHRLVSRAGFAADATRSEYGGQFLGLEATLHRAPGAVPGPPVAALQGMAAEFGRMHRQLSGYWGDRLCEWARRGQDVVLWGAGSKGSTFVNALLEDSRRAVRYIVDVNPRKHGRFVGGTGHAIVAPENLARDRPHTVIVMNPVYKGEVLAALEGMGLRSQVLAAGEERLPAG